MLLKKWVTGPVITEKSIKLGEDNKYVVTVALNATKGAIAQELKALFGVDCLNVRTLVMPGKKRRLLKTFRFKKTAKIKKAIVQLKEGQKIDLFTKEAK
jgi:large subunit ribosomal protein L23